MKLSINPLFVLCVSTCSLLSSCSPLVPIENACKGNEIEKTSVEGNLVVDWCNEADDGQIMCMMSVIDGENQLPVLLRTEPDKDWPLGMYPKLSFESVRSLLCGEDDACLHGLNKTKFHLTGECNPIKHWLFVKGFKYIKPIE
ncbi:MAG: hypothetical protein FD147_1935 [Chloroflexi bacterium]|nr:MAG: hypothetical protein FD147_1935 [Chloroflexota bacterium]